VSTSRATGAQRESARERARVYQLGDRCLVVEDVVTNGMSVNETNELHITESKLLNSCLIVEDVVTRGMSVNETS
jgi:orotate phosphoribosyltransferase